MLLVVCNQSLAFFSMAAYLLDCYSPALVALVGQRNDEGGEYTHFMILPLESDICLPAQLSQITYILTIYTSCT